MEFAKSRTTDRALLSAEKVKEDAAMISMDGNCNEVLGLLTALNEGVTAMLLQSGMQTGTAIALLQVAAEEGIKRAILGRGRCTRCQ